MPCHLSSSCPLQAGRGLIVGLPSHSRFLGMSDARLLWNNNWHQTWENPAHLSQLELCQKQLLYIKIGKKMGCQRGSSSGVARE